MSVSLVCIMAWTVAGMAKSEFSGGEELQCHERLPLNGEVLDDSFVSVKVNDREFYIKSFDLEKGLRIFNLLKPYLTDKEVDDDSLTLSKSDVQLDPPNHLVTVYDRTEGSTKISVAYNPETKLASFFLSGAEVGAFTVKCSE